MFDLFIAALAAGSVQGFVPGITVSMDNSNAVACYRAAQDGARQPDSTSVCDQALVQPLSEHDQVATYSNRGVLHMIQGNLSAAIADFAEAGAIDPEQPEVWLNKGILLVRMERSGEALAPINRSLALRTKHPELAFYARGLANEDSGRIGAAYADLRRAQALAPSWGAPAMQLSRYEVRQR